MRFHEIPGSDSVYSDLRSIPHENRGMFAWTQAYTLPSISIWHGAETVAAHRKEKSWAHLVPLDHLQEPPSRVGVAAWILWILQLR